MRKRKRKMRLSKRDGKGIEVRQEMKEGQGRRAGGSEEMRRWKGKRERERVRGERTEGREKMEKGDGGTGRGNVENEKNGRNWKRRRLYIGRGAKRVEDK